MNLRISLRNFREDDLDPIKSWINNPLIKYNFRFTLHIKSDDDLRKFISTQIERKNSDDFINYVIFDKKNLRKKYIGSVGLKNINLFDKNAELTIVIGDTNYHGKGFGQEALYLICKYGFDKLELHKIYLGVIEHNKNAIRAYEKFGFVHEGVRKEQIFQKNKYFDEIFMGMNRNQFNTKYEKI